MISQKISKALRFPLELTFSDKKTLKIEDGASKLQQIRILSIFDQFSLQNINV